MNEDPYIKYQVISFEDSKSFPVVLQSDLRLHDAIEYCLAGIRKYSTDHGTIESVLESHSHVYGLTFAALGPILSKEDLEAKLNEPIDDTKERSEGLELKGGGMVHHFWQVVKESLEVKDLTGEELYSLFEESCRGSTGEDPSWQEISPDHWQQKTTLH